MHPTGRSSALHTQYLGDLEVARGAARAPTPASEQRGEVVDAPAVASCSCSVKRSDAPRGAALLRLVRPCASPHQEDQAKALARSRPRATRRLCDSLTRKQKPLSRCDACDSLEAVETDEDLDDTRISERDVVADGVKLSIEAHHFCAPAAARIVRLGHVVRFAADAVPRPDLRRRPFESGRSLGLRCERVGLQKQPRRDEVWRSRVGRRAEAGHRARGLCTPLS
jgi:hypothetical protein